MDVHPGGYSPPPMPGVCSQKELVLPTWVVHVVHLLLLDHHRCWVLTAAAHLAGLLIPWVVVLPFEALVRVLEAGLGHLVLVGNGVFLGHALGGREGTAHLPGWLVGRARRGERTRDGCFLDLGPRAGLVEGQKLPRPQPVTRAVGAACVAGARKGAQGKMCPRAATQAIILRIWWA